MTRAMRREKHRERRYRREHALRSRSVRPRWSWPVRSGVTGCPGLPRIDISLGSWGYARSCDAIPGRRPTTASFENSSRSTVAGPLTESH